MRENTDNWPWYWLSYGEKCYAFAVVSALPVEEEQTAEALSEAGTQLQPHPVNERSWITDNGIEMMTMDHIANIERQSGGTICRFIAEAHTHLMNGKYE